MREGLGEGTNNDAEYRSLIRGLKTALDMGYDRIHAKGDSRLVVEQVYSFYCSIYDFVLFFSLYCNFE